MSTRPICMLTDWLMCMSMFWLCINLKGLVLVDGADIGAAGISEQLEAKNLVEQVVGNTTKLPQVEKLPPIWVGGRLLKRLMYLNHQDHQLRRQGLARERKNQPGMLEGIKHQLQAHARYGLQPCLTMQSHNLELFMGFTLILVCCLCLRGINLRREPKCNC